MEFNFSSKPNRRFLSRMGITLVVFALAAFAGKLVDRDGFVESPLIWAVAVAHALAMVGFFYAIVMLIVEQKDEFIRMLILRQLTIGTGIALTFASVWGFLEYFKLVAHIYPFYFAVAFFVGFGFGGLVNRLTHGAWGEMS